MNILITGVAGLIGCNFSHYLLENKDKLGIKQIFGIDNLSGGYEDNLPIHNDFYFYQIDLTKDFAEIENIFKKENIDYIFHFAAYAAEGLSPFIRVFNYQSNVISTAFLINMAIKYSIKRYREKIQVC